MSEAARDLFIVILRSSTNRSDAGRFLAGHREWIKRGRADGTFLMVGTLQPDAGGVIQHPRRPHGQDRRRPVRRRRRRPPGDPDDQTTQVDERLTFLTTAG